MHNDPRKYISAFVFTAAHLELIVVVFFFLFTGEIQYPDILMYQELALCAPIETTQ